MTGRASAGLVLGFLAALTWVGCGGETFNSGTGSTGGQAGSGGSQGGSGGSAGNGGSQGGNGGSQGGSGGSVDWGACDAPGTCVAVPTGCCGYCGQGTVDDVAGVNRSQVGAFNAQTCTDTDPVCPGCASMPSPYLDAFCEAGRCVVKDLRKDELSDCSSNSDCALRYPGCCETCGEPDPYNLIALSRDKFADYASAVCSPFEGACPPCVPSYPAGYAALCGETGYCEVAEVANLCPDDVPGFGQTCSQWGMQCEYGDDPRVSCRTQAYCNEGVWDVAVSGCPPLGGISCPDVPPPSGTDCQEEGLICPMPNGGLCACSACLGGPCGQIPRWGCVGASTQPGCPPNAPRLGTPCDVAVNQCVYGICATATSAGRSCEGGIWVDNPIACPE